MAKIGVTFKGRTYLIDEEELTKVAEKLALFLSEIATEEGTVEEHYTFTLNRSVLDTGKLG